MSSTPVEGSPSIVYRPVEKHEQQQALDLWYSIFTSTPGYHERYFSPQASPRYQDGDTWGAWSDGKLVSTVHIRRLTLRARDDNTEYLCGGIANVATLPEYRRRGLSRHLLRMCIAKMELGNEFDLCMLGTDRHAHYKALGWEQIPEPYRIIIDWRNSALTDHVEWRSVADLQLEESERLMRMHADQPRVYQIDRSPSTMFHDWVRWEWQNDSGIVLIQDNEGEQGYVVIGKPDSEEDCSVLEWSAPNVNVEKELLTRAADEIRRRHAGKNMIPFHALPQHMTKDELEQWAGPARTEMNEDAMWRNIRLPSDVYDRIMAAYSSGTASYWAGDYF